MSRTELEELRRLDALERKSKGETVPKSDVPAAKPSKETKQASGGFEPGKVAESGVGGAALGYFSPELLTGAGLVAGAFPVTAPASPYLLGAGQAARATRLGSSVAGGLGAAGGETAAQALDVLGAGKGPQEVGRTLVEMFGPGAVKGLIKRTVPGSTELFQGTEKGFKEAGEYFAGKLRGKLAATERGPQEAVIGALEKEADFLRNLGKSQANQILENAENEASKIAGSNAAAAQKIRDDARDRANKVLQGVEEKIEQARRTRYRALGAGTKEQQKVQSAKDALGVGKEQTDIGTSLRDEIVKVQGKLLDERDVLRKTNIADRDAEVLLKQQQGVFPDSTKDYQDVLRYLESKIGKGEGAKAKPFERETDPGVLNNLQIIYNALAKKNVQNEAGQIVEGKSVPFNAVDTIRRRLGEAAFGKKEAAEGYGAIGENNAKDLYVMLSKALGQYSPAHKKFINDYEEASRVLKPFGTSVAKKATAVDRFDKERFLNYAAQLPETYFKNAESVDDLIELTGGNKGLVAREAGSYVARRLEGATTESAVRNFERENRDWLRKFPEIQGKVLAYADALKRAESVVPKTEKLARELKIEIPKYPEMARKEAKGIIKAGEEEAKIAESGTGGLLGSAKQQAREAQALANAKAKLLSSLGKDPALSFDALIRSGNTDRLRAAAPVINRDPEIKKQFVDGLQISLSRTEPKQLADNWERLIKPALLDTGLIDKTTADRLSKEVRQVDIVANPDMAKYEWINRVRNAVIGATAQTAQPLLEQLGIGGFNYLMR